MEHQLPDNTSSHPRPERQSACAKQTIDLTAGPFASAPAFRGHSSTDTGRRRVRCQVETRSHQQWTRPLTPSAAIRDARIKWFFPIALAVSVNLASNVAVDASLPLGNPFTEQSADREQDRTQMVERQLLTRNIRDPLVIAAMRKVPREQFVPTDQQPHAYQDRPLPIGYQQTISQPYIVAYMTQVLQLTPASRVLEIGTGSGYQAAILGEIVSSVFSIEIVPELSEQASNTLTKLGYDNVHVRQGDGYAGWPDQAPFDAIIVTAAPNHVPRPLVDQLAVGGRMIVPVGDERQMLTEIFRTPDGVTEETTLPVLFVPMTGLAGAR